MAWGMYDAGGFPCVAGCLDGTHVAINAPAGREELFVNRHGTHSINVQVGDKYVINI